MKTVPKVTLLLRYFTVGGLERVVSSLCNGYVSQGIDTQVVVLSSGKRNALITELDPRVGIALLSGSWPSKLRELRRMTEGRLVHIHFGDGRIHPSVRLALLGRRLVITYHSVYSHKRSWIKNRFDRFFSSQASRVIAVSDAVKEFCVSEVGIPGSKVTVIQNGVPPPMAKAETPRGGPLYAISLASLYPHKNHGVLLSGLAMAKRWGANLRLRMIGDGPKMAELFQQCVSLGLREDLDWYGAVWRADIVQPLLSSSQLFVSASRYEGLPLSLLEGMAFGLPLILSDIPPHREVAGDAALYFPPNDPSAFAERLIRVLREERLREDLAAGSAARARAFSLDKCIEQHIAAYSGAASA